MTGGMQKVMFCFAQRFLVVLADVAGQIGLRMVDRLGECEPAFMFLDFMCHPLRIEASSANTGHQHDKYRKTNSLPEGSLIAHQISLARKNPCTPALVAEITRSPRSNATIPGAFSSLAVLAYPWPPLRPWRLTLQLFKFWVNATNCPSLALAAPLAITVKAFFTPDSWLSAWPAV